MLAKSLVPCLFVLSSSLCHCEVLKAPSSLNTLLHHQDPLLRVTNLPHFVGFSYNRASNNPPSPRFIHFLNENLNVNANFLPTYGSFEAKRPGVYYFTYSFLSAKSGAAIVSLRVNGRTIASAISEEGNHNPVTQSALYLLRPGDVVRLEVIEGKVSESNNPEFASTSFSGWLISSQDDTSSSSRPPFRRHDDECCCTNVCRDNHLPEYPHHPPTYVPPQPPPVLTTRPPFIYTTQPPPFHHRPPFNGRDDDGCCDSVLVSSGLRRTLDVQQEKFGVYRLHEISPRDGRAVFKHCENNVYLYYYNSPTGWAGWLAGPQIGGRRGGLILESEASCVERDLSKPWQFYDAVGFVEDRTISVTCFTNDGSHHTGRSLGDGSADHTHYHHHEHFHHDDGQGLPRSLSPPGPGYNIKSNPDFVEATFVFPNSNATGSAGYGPHHILQGLGPQAVQFATTSGNNDNNDLPSVVDARSSSSPKRNGIILRRASTEEEDDGDEDRV